MFARPVHQRHNPLPRSHQFWARVAAVRLGGVWGANACLGRAVNVPIAADAATRPQRKTKVLRADKFLICFHEPGSGTFDDEDWPRCASCEIFRPGPAGLRHHGWLWVRDIEPGLLSNGSDRLRDGRYGLGNQRSRLRSGVRHAIPIQLSGYARFARQGIWSSCPAGPDFCRHRHKARCATPAISWLKEHSRFNRIKETNDENHTGCCGSIACLWRRRVCGLGLLRRSDGLLRRDVRVLLLICA